MIKKKKKIDTAAVKKLLPYIFVGILTLGITIFGSIDKNSGDSALSLNVINSDSYKISIDQVSELYIVADISNALNLASAQDMASNYVATTAMYESGQTTSGKLEKPSITNIAVSRGVIEYTVKEGESMDAIASKYGLTTDQIRWSNGLKTTEVSAGDLLYIPSKPGIVYMIKSGDSVASIAEKYGSSVTEIIALNDLEMSEISEGMRIVIKDGNLPETERPEYVAPRTTTYSYLGSSSKRENIEILGTGNDFDIYYDSDNLYAYGNCTKWAKFKRPDLPNNLGNARNWAVNAESQGYYVTWGGGATAGSIFQTTSGTYGHVGYVESVNSDGSLNVTEMNYRGWNVVTSSIIKAEDVWEYNYIH